MSDSYYVRSQGKVHGPFTFEDLKTKAGKGHLKKTHQVSTDQKTWLPARRMEGLFPAPPKVPQQLAKKLDQPDLGEPELVEVTLIEEDPFAAFPEDETEWHYCLQGDEETQGPISEDKLRRLFRSGRLPLDTLVWNETLSGWVEATRIPALHPVGPVITAEIPLIEIDPQFSPWENQDLPLLPMASASLVLGILGLLVGVFGSGMGMLTMPGSVLALFGFAVPGGIASLLAVLFGYLALGQIKTNRRRFQGESLAKAGLILGLIVLMLLLFGGSAWLIVKLANG